jgi:hypothetical protein
VAQEVGFSPGTDMELALTGHYAWPDAPHYSSYQILIRRQDTRAVVHSAVIAGNDPAICPNDSQCVLKPGMAGYPNLETRAYEWVVFGFNTGTGTWQWWNPSTWSPFYAMPNLPGTLAANWNGNQLQLDWPAAAGAAYYRADIGNVFTKDYAQDYLCAAPACSATSNVSHIPFGTILVAMRSCGIHGRCTQAGTKAEAYRAPPNPVEAPNILLPAADGTVTGMTDVVWQDQANIERWNIRIEKDTGGPTMEPVAEESPWRGIAKCELHFCSRQYALTPGLHVLTVAAYSGGIWGPSTTIAFTVDANGVTPQLVSPATGQTTSIYPLLVWKPVAGVKTYVLSVKSNSALVTKTVTCQTAVCSYDLLKENWPLAPAAYSWSARVNVEGMPSSPPRTFTTSFTYVPAAPEITQPLEDESLGLTDLVTTVFLADPQVPFFSLAIKGPGGFFVHTSPPVKRHASDCQLVQVDNQLKLSCLYTNPSTAPLSCTSTGPHEVRVKTYTYTDMSGANMSLSESVPREFTRLCEPIGGSNKAIYTIYAQNMQFLADVAWVPVPHATSMDLTKVYGTTNRGRVLELVKYIRQNDFDVVALSEIFTAEARDFLSLHMRLGYPWQFGHIDTAGDVAFTLREGFPHESTSGLAIYSQFPAVSVPKNWNSNSQCTSDLFNQISETHPLYENPLLSLNDHLWFNQYCEAEGMDAMAAKGMAAIRLNNPKTGVPLVIAWSHTQAATNQGPITEAGLPLPNDYSYKDSYRKRESQLQEARDSLAHILGTMPAAFDAFVFGDWNVPQPKSVSSVPRWDGTTDTAGKPDLAAPADPSNPSAMYDTACAVSGCDDPKNPRYAALVGAEYDPTPDGWSPQTLYSQYWRSFDPRNTGRYLPQFYDLWLENPAGDFGFTYDRRNPAAHCPEAGEPCHFKNPQGFDHGQRYDTVLARFHGSNMENTQRTSGTYPGGHPSWRGKRSCVQHTRLARDFGKSDHYGTIIEVGPEQPFCSPMTAKAAAQDRMSGAPTGFVPPADKAFNKYLGVHEGYFAHGGANEWLYISEKGSYDFVFEGGLPIWIEAYDRKDLSIPLEVADSTQKKKGGLFGSPACNREAADVSVATFGFIPESCATSETRVTYKSPGPFYARIYPVNVDGTRCLTCTGNYRVRIRSRSCKIVWEAVPTVAGLTMADWERNPEGWFGPGQRNCWFSVELRQPTLAADHQTFTLGDLATANSNRCAQSNAPGTCSRSYVARLYHKGTVQTQPHEVPPGEIIPPITHDAGTNGSNIVTGPSWNIDAAAKNDHHREQFLWLLERSDASKAHVALLPWYTDLKSVLFRSIRALEIDDDDKFICVPIPFVGCVPIRDPWQTEDEGRISTSVNGAPVAVLRHDFEKASVYLFPNAWPGSMPNEPRNKVYVGTPGAETWGTTINFTGSASVHAEDIDDDSTNDALVADHLMVGIPTAPEGDKQTHEIIFYRLGEELREVPFLWDFTDTGFLGAKVHYELDGRILRDP